ncbi:MAG: tRNA pseudouridine(38-40) synthase TruA [Chloroflexi bacterium]|uniref:tRNA pseudouridine synthase A n=1 Tax=Candidatus Chlorohelix allophototropha TaxID=3003348 RepID=A0A8T7M254_9CHLR|nr:tRNA pseudouridine(38-40) synthase TruA [Chloroflexota bacterium]WJW65653.1 tRNA pseudouridine(38-40) synthase TruA [Chloroflexota bacterium L227-S17]
MRNIKLVLEYDGTNFAGSQLQANGRTVQGELERAIAELTGLSSGAHCRVQLAGRTDSGVHAEGQVANFKTDSNHSTEIFRRGLNALLPVDLVVTIAEEVSKDFHARFSATEREYRYEILNRRSRSPLSRHYVHWVKTPLDVNNMAEAGKVLVGRHDFASFAGAGMGVPDTESEGKPGTVRELRRLEWRSGKGSLIEFWVAANAFLPHMVRNIVGTLLEVGAGKINLREFEEIFAACDRRRAGPTAPPSGLYLVSVKY